MDLIAIGAHPDDCELFVGGTLAKLAKKGCEVGIIDLTQGELSTRGNLEQRKKETERASQILGITSRVSLDLGDTVLENNLENRTQLVRALRELRPKIMLLQYPEDRHPDHVKAALIAKDASFYVHVAKIVPEIEPFHPQQVISYIGNTDFTSRRPDFIVDITETFEQKLDSLRSYKTQFFNPIYKDDSTFISSKDFWETITARARLYGSMIGVTYGEAFCLDRPMKIDDPVDFFVTT